MNANTYKIAANLQIYLFEVQCSFYTYEVTPSNLCR